MIRGWIFALTLIISISTHGNSQSDITNTSNFSVDNSMVYGSFCGIAGQQPPMRDKLIEAVINNDLKTIKKWLYSDHPVKQAYATEGYLILKSTGSIKENSALESKIMQLATSDIETNFCSGCMRGSYRLGDVIGMILTKDI